MSTMEHFEPRERLYRACARDATLAIRHNMTHWSGIEAMQPAVRPFLAHRWASCMGSKYSSGTLAGQRVVSQVLAQGRTSVLASLQVTLHAPPRRVLTRGRMMLLCHTFITFHSRTPLALPKATTHKSSLCGSHLQLRVRPHPCTLATYSLCAQIVLLSRLREHSACQMSALLYKHLCGHTLCA